MSLFLALLHRLLTNQEMMMDQLKVIQMTMQKIPGEPAGGPDPLGRDILPLKDVTSLLALEKRVREEADLQNKMVIIALTNLKGWGTQFETIVNILLAT